MGDTFQQPEDPRQPPARRWLSTISWPMVLATGWVVYEITAQPALGVAFACCKFGWDDIRIGFWLYRIDRNSGRGLAMLLFCFTYGLWKVSFTATMMTGAFLAVHPNANQWGFNLQNLPPAMLGAVTTAVIGFGACSIGGLMATVVAYGSGVQIWFQARSLYSAWRQNLAPTYFPANGRKNEAPLLLGVTSVPALLVSLIFVPLLATQLVATVIGVPKLSWLGIAVFLGAACATMTIYGDLVHHVVHRITADVPKECWNEQELVDEVLPDHEAT